MDVSEKYILMCEKAQEIQDLDFIRDEFSFYSEEESFEKGGYEIWLPRQDQLQDMIEIDEYLLEDFSRGMRLAEYPHGWGLSDHYMYQFQTMEQLWLAEVMRTNHNKIWNQEKEEWEIKA